MPNAEIILGGPEVSYKWEKFMANMPEVDALLLGEGENVLLNFLTKEEDKVLGVDSRKNDEIIFNGIEPIIENLDIVPFPYEDWEL